MSDTSLPVAAAGSPTHNLDGESLTVGATTVMRERVQVTGTGATHIAPVSATLGLSVNVTNLAKNEDDAHTSGDAGVQALSVRKDTAAALAGTDGDYQPLVTDASGRLHVNVGNTVTVGSHAVTNAGTFAVQLVEGGVTADVLDLTNNNPLAVALVDLNGDQISSFGGGTQYTEDAAAAADPVGTIPILVRKDTPSTTVTTDGDNIAQRGTNYGAAYVTLLDTGGTPVSVGGGTQYTEDAAAAANPIGNALIVVREDARAGSLVTTDGDNVALRGNNFGELYVKHTDTISISTLTTSIVPGTGATHLGKAEDDAHTSGDVGVMALAKRGDVPAATSGADGDYEPLQVAGGLLWARIRGLQTPNGDSCLDETNDAVKVSVVADSVGSTVDTEDGSVAGGQSTVAMVIGLPYDWDGSNWVRRVTSHIIDDAAFTPATSGVTMAGFEADETGTDSVDEGDAGAGRMTLDRKQIVNPQPHTQGGLSISRDIDLDNSTLTVVKAAPGMVYGWYLSNRTTAPVYVKFYDATSGTLGTGTPVMTLEIPGNSTDHVAANVFSTMGIEFTTGICVGAGTGVADNDNTDPGANGVVANIFYK